MSDQLLIKQCNQCLAPLPLDLVEGNQTVCLECGTFEDISSWDKDTLFFLRETNSKREKNEKKFQKLIGAFWRVSDWGITLLVIAANLGLLWLIEKNLKFSLNPWEKFFIFFFPLLLFFCGRFFFKITGRQLAEFLLYNFSQKKDAVFKPQIRCRVCQAPLFKNSYNISASCGYCQNETFFGHSEKKIPSIIENIQSFKEGFLWLQRRKLGITLRILLIILPIYLIPTGYYFYTFLGRDSGRFITALCQAAIDGVANLLRFFFS